MKWYPNIQATALHLQSSREKEPDPNSVGASAAVTILEWASRAATDLLSFTRSCCKRSTRWLFGIFGCLHKVARWLDARDSVNGIQTVHILSEAWLSEEVLVLLGVTWNISVVDFKHIDCTWACFQYLRLRWSQFYLFGNEISANVFETPYFKAPERF